MRKDNVNNLSEQVSRYVLTTRQLNTFLEDLKDLIQLNSKLIINSNKEDVKVYKKQIKIEEFINITNINKEEDGYREWEHYIDKTKEKEITDIIKAENLKEKDTLSYINNAFRDGEIKTFGVDFDKLLPPISRFSREENRQEKKNSIADKLIRFFEKFYNIS